MKTGHIFTNYVLPHFFPSSFKLLSPQQPHNFLCPGVTQLLREEVCQKPLVGPYQRMNSFLRSLFLNIYLNAIHSHINGYLLCESSVPCLFSWDSAVFIDIFVPLFSQCWTLPRDAEFAVIQSQVKTQSILKGIMKVHTTAALQSENTHHGQFRPQTLCKEIPNNWLGRKP